MGSRTKLVALAIGAATVAGALGGCVTTLGSDVVEMCESHIEKTLQIDVVAAEIRAGCLGQRQPVLCARADIRDLRELALKAAMSLDEMADYYLGMWGIDPNVASDLREHCPLAREVLFEAVNNLDALLLQVDDPAFWDPNPATEPS